MQQQVSYFMVLWDDAEEEGEGKVEVGDVTATVIQLLDRQA